jgi:tetratricopeptide (TPR) repeat protein
VLKYGLAITESTMDTHDLKIDELRRAAVADPRNGEIRYLLGAELAQQRRYDEAVLELSAAIALDPLLHTARLQLGLLHLTLAQPQHATAVLAALESLEDSSALKHFKRGIDALTADDLPAAAASLAHGIELNSDNAPLDNDMRMLLARINETIEGNNAQSGENPDAVRTDFSLYGVTRH